MEILEKIVDFILQKQVGGVIVVIVAAIIINKVINKVINKAINTQIGSFEIKRKRTLLELLENICKYVIVVITGLIILELYGVNTRSLVAGLGVVGVVIGLSLQDTLRDIISGATIILENYFIVGDFVKYNTFTGEVISFGLKSTKIKNVNGEVLIVSNRNITEVVNISQKAADIIIDIPVAYEEKVEKVEKAIEEILEDIKEIQHVKKSTVSYLGIDSLGDSSVQYRIKITCEQDKQWQIRRESLRIIKNTLDQKNIKIPYPQLEVHNAKTN